jgi:hypothetical protein
LCPLESDDSRLEKRFRALIRAVGRGLDGSVRTTFEGPLVAPDAMSPTHPPRDDACATAAGANSGGDTHPAPVSAEARDRESTVPSEQVAERVAAERDVDVRELPSLWRTLGLDLEALDRLLDGDRDAGDPVVHLEVDGVRLRVSADGVVLEGR